MLGVEIYSSNSSLPEMYISRRRNTAIQNSDTTLWQGTVFKWIIHDMNDWWHLQTNAKQIYQCRRKKKVRNRYNNTIWNPSVHSWRRLVEDKWPLSLFLIWHIGQLCPYFLPFECRLIKWVDIEMKACSHYHKQGWRNTSRPLGLTLKGLKETI